MIKTTVVLDDEDDVSPVLGEMLKEIGEDTVLAAEPQAVRRQIMSALHDLCELRVEFTADDLAKLMADRGIPDPHHPNVLGAAWGAASKKGWVTKTERTVKSVRPVQHAASLFVWRSNILPQPF